MQSESLGKDGAITISKLLGSKPSFSRSSLNLIVCIFTKFRKSGEDVDSAKKGSWATLSRLLTEPFKQPDALKLTNKGTPPPDGGLGGKGPPPPVERQLEGGGGKVSKAVTTSVFPCVSNLALYAAAILSLN